MIIDAMDILYTNRVDGFCLVSSDCDFTRLATRLREAGKLVIGIGEQKRQHRLSQPATGLFILRFYLMIKRKTAFYESKGKPAGARRAWNWNAGSRRAAEGE